MNKQPAAELSPAKKFESLLKRVLAVPRSEILRRDAIYKQQRAAKKSARANGEENPA